MFQNDHGQLYSFFYCRRNNHHIPVGLRQHSFVLLVSFERERECARVRARVCVRVRARVCVFRHVEWCMCRGQWTAFRSMFSPSTKSTRDPPRVTPRLAQQTNTLNYRATLMAHNIHFLSCNFADQKPDKNLSGLKAKHPKECIPCAGS